MKFAKTLEQECVPEWRFKYLDYKTGKKQVKAVARAVARARSTPQLAVQSTQQSPHKSRYGATSMTPKRSPKVAIKGAVNGRSEPLRDSQPPQGQETRPSSLPNQHQYAALPLLKPQTSIKNIVTNHQSLDIATTTSRQTLELPEPALGKEGSDGSNAPSSSNATESLNAASGIPPADPAKDAYQVGLPTAPSSSLSSLRSFPRGEHDRPLFKRIFSMGTPMNRADKPTDINMVNIDHVRLRQKEFKTFMQHELDKVGSFYKSKEDAASERLKLLQEQLHEMGERKLQEGSETQQTADIGLDGVHINNDSQSRRASSGQLQALINPLDKLVNQSKYGVRGTYQTASKKVNHEMHSSESESRVMSNGAADYARRPRNHEIPYRTAKRRLKLAFLQFYRGMELLKSYAFLNRTAFSKLNKKYDKAIDAHTPLRFMTELVDQAWFVRSEVLDGHMHAAEDLFARYFEKGNRKIAMSKLRASVGRTEDQSMNTFKNGLMIGIGAVFLICGIVDGCRLLQYDDPVIRIQTTYLMQIYGGYLLTLYLFSWFCIDCRIWTNNKINYTFIFDFDARHSLDWRELSTFPSFVLLLLGICVWLNFSRFLAQALFIYYPVILISITVLVIFVPFRVLFYRSRKWLVCSHGRLLLAGLFPVEFRDFFLGDMYCSLTYVTSNIELFFCLYAHRWDNPTQCNSSHSRLMGFLACLPAIWRALQCLRRYYDTRNIFPHLVNCGKYLMTIAYYASLSLYRIDRSKSLLIVFSVLATLNGIYVSIWDVVMDWSLLQPHANKLLLRDVRAFNSAWPYYVALILDPILRFNWIFYNIFTHNLQHSTLAAFFVAFTEISRRGMWTIFRVENEHCANVAGFKASRDIPLPYDLDLESSEGYTLADESSTEPTQTSPMLTRSRTSGVLAATTSAGSGTRRRLTRAKTLTDVLAEAHTQDFEKRRRPKDLAKIIEPREDENGNRHQDESSSDEVDEQDVLDAEALLRERMEHEG